MIRDLLYEISTVDPTDSPKAAIESAAEQIGVNATMLYRWIREGFTKTQFRHVAKFVELVNAGRIADRTDPVSLAQLLKMQGGDQ